MQQEGFFTHIKNYWIIYAFVVQLIINYTISTQALADHEKRITTLESTKIQDALNISEINSRLASIETSLVFIKDRVK